MPCSNILSPLMPIPKLSRYDGPTKLVMAFDIGATFSSVSYCILERGEVPEIWPVSWTK